VSARPAAALVLADGEVFEGEAIGARRVSTGEVVFNTVMCGYQEVLTDPSYAGQVVTFTYPHIGNYGAARGDAESRRLFCRGVVVRDLAERPSSWRAAGSLEALLERAGIPGVSGVDTRRLTRHVREAGSLPCALGPLEGPGAADEAALLAAARAERGTDGADLVREVTARAPYRVGEGPLRLVAYDFGVKTSILRELGRLGTVEVVPATTAAAEVLDRRPDGVVLSNGPGDPAALPYAVATVRELLGEVPLLGICLGHQLLAIALGGTTYKLRFGHHGGNHPVRRLATGDVEITSQNHNYAVAVDGLEGVEVTHVNLNDGVVEGLRCERLRAFGVQYHPEAGPGPHDARYLFEEFAELARTAKRGRRGTA
jgi:carbamoyl-phosphate synthase small subunit